MQGLKRNDEGSGSKLKINDRTDHLLSIGPSPKKRT